MKSNTNAAAGDKIKQRYITINGIRYHYAEASKGPLVILLHGFPELWYSWRYQIPVLAKAGYHVVAPDLRGFGESEVTNNVSDYSLFQHAADIKALIDHFGEKNAVVAGHDWGANVMWLMPMLYPEVIKAVVSVSIPFYPQPRDPAQMKSFSNGKFNFLDYFQKPGLAEAEFNHDPDRFFRLFFYGLSGDAPAGTVNTLYMGKPADAKLLDSFPEPVQLPSWLTEKDLDYYVTAYKKTGITGGLNFYRNINQDYARLKETYVKGIHQPVLFIGGGEEAAVKFGNPQAMKAALPGLKNIIILPRCGHWVQQEKAAEVNEALVGFLNQLNK